MWGFFPALSTLIYIASSAILSFPPWLFIQFYKSPQTSWQVARLTSVCRMPPLRWYRLRHFLLPSITLPPRAYCFLFLHSNLFVLLVVLSDRTIGSKSLEFLYTSTLTTPALIVILSNVTPLLWARISVKRQDVTRYLSSSAHLDTFLESALTRHSHYHPISS